MSINDLEKNFVIELGRTATIFDVISDSSTYPTNYTYTVVDSSFSNAVGINDNGILLIKKPFVWEIIIEYHYGDTVLFGWANKQTTSLYLQKIRNGTISTHTYNKPS